jgi:hypothetical protein
MKSNLKGGGVNDIRDDETLVSGDPGSPDSSPGAKRKRRNVARRSPALCTGVPSVENDVVHESESSGKSEKRKASSTYTIGSLKELTLESFLMLRASTDVLDPTKFNCTGDPGRDPARLANIIEYMKLTLTANQLTVFTEKPPENYTATWYTNTLGTRAKEVAPLLMARVAADENRFKLTDPSKKEREKKGTLIALEGRMSKILPYLRKEVLPKGQTSILSAFKTAIK